MERIYLSLNEYEGVDWGQPLIDTVTANAIHSARATPIDKLTSCQLNTLIKHDLGCKVLLGKAISRLKSNPLLKADYFRGDLLEQVLSTKACHWTSEEIQAMREILSKLRSQKERISELEDDKTIELIETWEAPPEGVAVDPSSRLMDWRKACDAMVRDSNPGFYANREKGQHAAVKHPSKNRSPKKRDPRNS